MSEFIPDSPRQARAASRQNRQVMQQQLDNLAAELLLIRQTAADNQRRFDDERKEMTHNIVQLQNLQVNKHMVGHQEMKDAEAVDYFATVFQPLVYPPGADVANAQHYEVKQWNDFLKNYTPKLTRKTDASTWFGVFENSCTMNDIPLEVRYKKLVSVLLDDDLKAKLLKKTTFFDGAVTSVQKYDRLRKWLCTDEALINSVQKAEDAIMNWVMAEKTLLLGCEKYLELVDHYIYAVRFAVTHGIDQSRFDVCSESRLFKNFVRKTKKDRIRQEAEKYVRRRNLTVLQIICKQVDKEISIPKEYQAEKKTPQAGDIYGIENEYENVDQDVYGPTDEVPVDDPEVYYTQQGRYSNGSRRQYRARGGYNNYRSKSYGNNYGSRGGYNNYGGYNNNRGGYRGQRGGYGGPQGNNNRPQARSKNIICEYCARTGHTVSVCYAKQAADSLAKLRKNGGSIADQLKVVRNREQQIRDRQSNRTRARGQIYGIDDTTASTGDDRSTANAAAIGKVNDESKTNDVGDSNDNNEESEFFKYTYPRQ